MDHRLLVRVLRRFADGAKYFQLPFDRAYIPPAIFRERKAFDILHYEPRSSVVEGICVVETRYRGVIQLRESALLAGEEFAACGREPRIAQKFDRDLRTQV